jgi:hypothetical protein
LVESLHRLKKPAEGALEDREELSGRKRTLNEAYKSQHYPRSCQTWERSEGRNKKSDTNTCPPLVARPRKPSDCIGKCLPGQPWGHC